MVGVANASKADGAPITVYTEKAGTVISGAPYNGPMQNLAVEFKRVK